MGVLSLAKKVGEDRLINACKRAIEYNLYNYKTVLNILEKGLDQHDNDILTGQVLPEHGNIRGKDNYR
jgi:hypothetical protein